MECYNDSSSFYNVVLDCRSERNDTDLAKDRAVGMERGQNLQILYVSLVIVKC